MNLTKQSIMCSKRKARRALSAWFQKYKQRFKCQECSEADSSALEFHHRDPKNKILAIADLISKGFSRKIIMREIEKCDVLCCNCHRKLTSKLRKRKKPCSC